MKKLIFIIPFITLLLGCAATQPVVKTYPNQQLPLRQPVKEVMDVSHFIIFKAPPDGVEVTVIDTTTGKEVAKLGTTPVRVLVLKKKVILLDGRAFDIQDIAPVANALSYGKGIAGGVEFQFKFRKYGFSDQMILERIPFLMGDSEKTIEVVMKVEK